MKRSTKRFFSILLVLAMLFTLAPMTLISASAEDGTGEAPAESKADKITLYVTKIVTPEIKDETTGEITTPAVTEEVCETVEDKTVPTSGTGWTWTPAEKVTDADGKTVEVPGYLTLKGFNGTYIESDQSLNIKLDKSDDPAGTPNRITGKSFDEEVPAKDGEETTEPETVKRVYGIRVKTGTITIDKTNSSLTDILTIDLGIVSDTAYAIHIDTPRLYGGASIDGGTVNILGTQTSDNGIYACSLTFGMLSIKNDSNLNVKLIKTGQAKENDETNVLLENGILLTVATSGAVDIDCTAFPDGTAVMNGITAERTFSGNVTVKAPTGIGKENAKVGVISSFRPEATGTMTFVGTVEFGTSIFDGDDYINNFEVVVPTAYEFRKSDSGNYVMYNPTLNEKISMVTLNFDVGEEKALELNENAKFEIPGGKYGETITPIHLATVIKPGTGNGSYSFTLGKDTEDPEKDSKLPAGLSLTRTGTITGKYTDEHAAGKVTVVAISNGVRQEFEVSYGEVTVNNPVTEVKVSNDNDLKNIDVGETITLKATLNSDADIKTVDWKSSNESILKLVSVSKDTLTATFKAEGEGEAEITATSTQGGIVSEPYAITTVDTNFYIVPDEDTGVNYVIQFGEKCTGHPGWFQLDNAWYYIDNDGALSRGWKQINGKWYYFDKAANDKMVIGWSAIGGRWYYFTSSGAMATGWAQISGKWYYLAPSGAMVTGWAQISGKWYYFNASGIMLTGWQQVGGKWYYFNNSGVMVTGWAQIRGKWYYFNNSGTMLTGWQAIGGKWYYFNSSGAMATGWQAIGGKWYYFNTSGVMLTGTQRINGRNYYFNASGVWIA